MKITRRNNLKPSDDWFGVLIRSPIDDVDLFEVFVGLDSDCDFDGRVLGHDIDEQKMWNIVLRNVNETDPEFILEDAMKLLKEEERSLPSWITRQVWDEVKLEKSRREGF